MTKTFKLELTKDELLVLKYVIPKDSWGDPLKDYYDDHQTDEPENVYAVLRVLSDKISSLKWEDEAKSAKEEVCIHCDGTGWIYYGGSGGGLSDSDECICKSTWKRLD